MTDSFDPYWEWLGLEARGGAPDHYGLLGLERLESDRDLIARAAERALTRVRQSRPGAHAAEWGRLLDELSEAKKCLLSPVKKAAYDARLMGRSAAASQEQVSEVSFTEDGMPSPANLPREATEVETDSAMSWLGFILTGVLAMTVGIGSVFAYLLYQRDGMVSKMLEPFGVPTNFPPAPENPAAGAMVLPPASSSPYDAASVARRVPVEAKAGQPNDARAERNAPSARRRSEAESVAPSATSAAPRVDARKAASFKQAVYEARRALAHRDLAGAERHIAAASGSAQTSSDMDALDRLKTLLDNLRQFWEGAAASMARFQPLEEIVLGGSRFVVVESAPDYLAVKSEGRVLRFKATSLSAQFLMRIADRDFGRDAGSRAIIGTFLAVDPEGDRALARRYWQEAARAGFDTEKLMPELDEAAYRRPAARQP